MTDEDESTVRKDVVSQKLESESQPSTPSPQPAQAQYPRTYQPPVDPYRPPSQTPPPYYYTPPTPPPQPTYTWEMFPHLARNLFKSKINRRPVLTLIGVLLIIATSLAYPMVGIFIYYGTSEDIDFGGTFTLEGKIVDGDENGISGAQIEILGTSLSTFSDSAGFYEIRDTPTGIKKIRITTPGYKNETNIVLLHPEFGQQIDFQLQDGTGVLEFNNLWFFFTLAILTVMFSAFKIAGAYYAFKGKRFAVVLVGGILGILVFSPPLLFTFIPSIFFLGVFGFITSFSAMIMSVTNRKGFTKTEYRDSPDMQDIAPLDMDPQKENQEEGPGQIS